MLDRINDFQKWYLVGVLAILEQNSIAISSIKDKYFQKIYEDFKDKVKKPYSKYDMCIDDLESYYSELRKPMFEEYRKMLYSMIALKKEFSSIKSDINYTVNIDTIFSESYEEENYCVWNQMVKDGYLYKKDFKKNSFKKLFVNYIHKKFPSSANHELLSIFLCADNDSSNFYVIDEFGHKNFQIDSKEYVNIPLYEVIVKSNDDNIVFINNGISKEDSDSDFYYGVASDSKNFLVSLFSLEPFIEDKEDISKYFEISDNFIEGFQKTLSKFVIRKDLEFHLNFTGSNTEKTGEIYIHPTYSCIDNEGTYVHFTDLLDFQKYPNIAKKYCNLLTMSLISKGIDAEHLKPKLKTVKFDTFDWKVILSECEFRLKEEVKEEKTDFFITDFIKPFIESMIIEILPQEIIE